MKLSLFNFRKIIKILDKITNHLRQILKYLQGASTPDETEKILAWLAQSEENRNTYFQLKALWHAFKDNFENDQLNLEKSLEAYRARINPAKKISFFGGTVSRLHSNFLIPTQTIVPTKNIQRN